MENKFVETLKKAFYKVSFQAKKHSPEIILVAGITGTIASTVLACRATIKAKDVVDEAKETTGKINEALEREDLKDKYTEEDAKRDRRTNFVQTSVKLAKLYLPSVILGGLSIAGIVGSNGILKKRSAAIAAAYATAEKSFEAYRERVKDRFGEDVEREIHYNIKAKEIEETTTDKKGKETTTRKVVNTIDADEPASMYARFFDKYTKDEKGNVVLNNAWTNDPEVNLAFLRAQQAYANDLLNVKGYLFLNEVYKQLGLPETKAGQVVGWSLKKGDTFVDFGIYKSSDNYNDFINGFDPILLDFNVAGNIWDDMTD